VRREELPCGDQLEAPFESHASRRAEE
jgi:hypothetical protein